MKKKFVVIVVSLLLELGGFSQAIVFDPTNFIPAIDTLYTAYDQVMTTIEQLKQTYDYAQKYYNEIKGWEFGSIRWDGDWDFRDEIGSATKSINRQLTNMRRFEANLQSPKIQFGNQRFSLKDLMSWNADKNFVSALKHSSDWMVNESLKKAAEQAAGKMSEREKKAVYAKYGLSPVNYAFYQSKKNVVDSAVSQVVTLGLEETIEDNIKIASEAMNSIVSSGLEGEQTEKELLQKMMLQNQQLHEAVISMNTTMAKTGSAIALQMQKEEQEAQLKKDSNVTVSSGMPDALFLLSDD